MKKFAIITAVVLAGSALFCLSVRSDEDQVNLIIGIGASILVCENRADVENRIKAEGFTISQSKTGKVGSTIYITASHMEAASYSDPEPRPDKAISEGGYAVRYDFVNYPHISLYVKFAHSEQWKEKLHVQNAVVESRRYFFFKELITPLGPPAYYPDSP